MRMSIMILVCVCCYRAIVRYSNAYTPEGADDEEEEDDEDD